MVILCSSTLVNSLTHYSYRNLRSLDLIVIIFTMMSALLVCSRSITAVTALLKATRPTPLFLRFNHDGLRNEVCSSRQLQKCCNRNRFTESHEGRPCPRELSLISTRLVQNMSIITWRSRLLEMWEQFDEKCGPQSHNYSLP